MESASNSNICTTIDVSIPPLKKIKSGNVKDISERRVIELSNDIFKNNILINHILSFVPFHLLTSMLVNRRLCKLIHNIMLSRLILKDSSKLVSSGFTKRILFMNEEFSEAYLPYRVVKLMATTIPDAFVNKIHKESLVKLQAETSCIHNLYALMVIFCGKDKADIIEKRLLLDTLIDVNIDLPNGGKWKLKVKNLFSGDSIIQLKKIIPDHLYTNDNKNLHLQKSVNQSINRYLDYINPLVNKFSKTNKSLDKDVSIISFLKTAIRDYNFNLASLSNLYSTIMDNINLADKDNSYIYYIVISQTLNKLEKVHGWYIYHALAIEQYFSKSHNSNRYRIYQSWVDKMSLKNYFSKTGYGDLDEGSMSWLELSNFISMLGIILKGEPDEKLREKCFGYVEKDQPIKNLFFYSEENILTGLTFRFIETRITPGDCLQNFESALKNIKER